MRTLTLFAGAGGADCGMRDAGAEHVRCIEYDASAAATLKAAGFPAVCGDVRDPTLYRNLPPIGLMWASPPCQDWSSAGKREGASGSRNGWPWTWLAVDHLRRRGLGPEWFVAENVPGMLTHSGEHCGSGCCADPGRCPRTYFLEVIMREARARFAWAEWRVLDAASFGVPQFRKRVFIVAGPRPIRWPQPTHGEPTTQTGLFGPALLPWVTVRDALGLDCGTTGAFGLGRPLQQVTGPAPTVTCEVGRSNPWGAAGTPFVVGSFIRTEATGAVATPDTEPASGGGLRVIGGGCNPQTSADAHKRTLRDITDEPSTTIAAQSGGGAGNAGPFVVGSFIRTEATGAVATPDTEPAPTVPTKGNQYLHATDPGVRVSRSRTGKLRIEYALKERPDSVRGPSDLVRRHPVEDPDLPANAATGGAPKYLLTCKDNRTRQTVDRPAPTLRAGGAVDQTGKQGGGSPHYIERAGSQPERLDRPSLPVLARDAKGYSGSAGRRHSPCGASDALFLATGRRRLTVAECSTLQDFPPDYPWQGTKTSQYRQIGNAVPRRVAEVLTRAVMAAR